MRAVLCGLLSALLGCSEGSATTELVVFAASSLTEPFGDLEREFEQEHPEKVWFEVPRSCWIVDSLQTSTQTKALRLIHPSWE